MNVWLLLLFTFMHAGVATAYFVMGRPWIGAIWLLPTITWGVLAARAV